MRIPAVEKGMPFAELHKVAGKTVFCRPVDDIQHIFQADRAFDADRAVPVRRLFLQMDGDVRQVPAGDIFAISAGPHPAAAGSPQELVHRQEHAAAVHPRDASFAALDIDENPIIQIRNGKTAARAFHLRDQTNPEFHPSPGEYKPREW